VREVLVDRNALASRLHALRSAEGDSAVYVGADKKIGYGELMEIVGRIKESGYDRVSLVQP
jgi:biopolymer transport protein TolR